MLAPMRTHSTVYLATLIQSVYSINSFQTVRSRRMLQECTACSTLKPESSLDQIEAVQARLAQNGRDIQAQIDELTVQLKSSQDPSRMQLIQEMISVS